MFNASKLLLPVLLGGLLPGGSFVCAPRVVAAPLATLSTKGVVDVTVQVRALVSDNALEVKSETALAGADPARKIVKRLVVIYSFGGSTQAVTAMEGETLKLAAPDGQTLNIEKALYGDVKFPYVDVAEKLRAGLKNNRVSLPVNVNLAGVVPGQPARDPAPGQNKALRVGYIGNLNQM